MLSAEVLAAAGPGPIGVAVSGGSDSIALLILAHEAGLPVVAATVNHGLRAEAGAEADAVAKLCAQLTIPHETLRWTYDPGDGNLQQAARTGRRQLLAEWILRQGGDAALLGHTEDDVAETLLMRLERGSGVDGLSAMEAVSRHHGVRWLRPLLSTRRAALRDLLNARGLSWAEDASNADTRFRRARMRRVIEEGGLDIPRLAGTSHAMRDARTFLVAETEALRRACITVTLLGEVIIAVTVYSRHADDLRFRLLRALCRWMNGRDFAPRHEKILRLDQALRDGFECTVSGMQLRLKGRIAHLRREPRAVTGLDGSIWDHRWQIACTADRWSVTTLAALERAAWPTPAPPHPSELMQGAPALLADGRPAVVPGGAARLHGTIRLIPFTVDPASR